MKPILELQKNNMKEQILDAYGVLFEEKLIDEIIEVSELRNFFPSKSSIVSVSFSFIYCVFNFNNALV